MRFWLDLIIFAISILAFFIIFKKMRENPNRKIVVKSVIILGSFLIINRLGYYIFPKQYCSLFAVCLFIAYLPLFIYSRKIYKNQISQRNKIKNDTKNISQEGLFCPKCKTEYENWVKICADCKVPLVKKC